LQIAGNEPALQFSQVDDPADEDGGEQECRRRHAEEKPIEKENGDERNGGVDQ